MGHKLDFFPEIVARFIECNSEEELGKKHHLSHRLVAPERVWKGHSPPLLQQSPPHPTPPPPPARPARSKGHCGDVGRGGGDNMEIQVFPPQFKCASLGGSSQAQGECCHPEWEMPK